MKNKNIGWFIIPAALLVIVFLYLFLWKNPAQAQLAPIEHALTSVSGQKICSDGNNGLDIGNNEPWYSIAYSVPSTDQNAVVNRIKELGYSLTQVTDENEVGTKTGYAIDSSHFNSESTYYIGNRGSDKLRIVISRSQPGYISCSDSKAQTETALSEASSNQRVVLDISLQKPSR